MKKLLLGLAFFGLTVTADISAANSNGVDCYREYQECLARGLPFRICVREWIACEGGMHCR
ncbi:hypothetical protein [Marinicella sp. W31]|uniref:hypothetical protein n=1 Tax=Marinicella sp. W31 TaxID=3023713 RepID=UPI0037578065